MTETVTQWIRRHAHPLTTLDPQAPLTDLSPLADLIGDAKVVAIGASTRQAHELAALAHRTVRLLVEDLGFRSLALEGDDAARVGLGEYIRSGTGNPEASLSGARSFWRTEEMLDLVRWMRSYNRRNPDDQVRFTEGVGSSRTRTPQRQPQSQSQPQPQPQPQPDDRAEIDRNLAESVMRWHERSGDKIVYLGGLAHTANGDSRTTYPTSPPMTHRNAGSHMREHFGSGYLSVGLTFHHGMAPYPIPAPPAEFADAVLGSAGLDAYALDLHGDGPAAVRAWLDAPARTRVIGPAYDPADNAAYRLSGGSLADWFDVILHSRVVTPVRLLE
ncbi:erythromycin esterase family protein [Streptomyces sp. NBC_01433]|uniref:erythromycin esterase family protein n=1 Tax=Streptomyces sp. NBC_01433 TaxID=2903864 RepID=UPI00225888B2|nr:erythromycin esterase family protein [Streptomyces sp. NBC_01433]MCX4680285.1 erythromycin esterase family protein [Streptomyces sp. NBC_01433]